MNFKERLADVLMEGKEQKPKVIKPWRMREWEVRKFGVSFMLQNDSVGRIELTSFPTKIRVDKSGFRNNAFKHDNTKIFGPDEYDKALKYAESLMKK